MNGLRKFLALPSRRRWLLVDAIASLAICRIGLAVGSVGTAGRLLDTTIALRSRLPPEGEQTRTDLVWAVETADALVPGSGTCLRVALVGDRMFAAHGYESTLRIGVATDGGPFAAHAWVEGDGGVLVGDITDLSRFRPLPLDTADRLFDRP